MNMEDSMENAPHTSPNTPRAEQQFFDDPAMDRLMGTVMALAQEHYVLRDRVRALEGELARTKALNPAALDQEPTPEQRAETTADRSDFVEALLKPLLGQQEALGAPGRHSLKANG
jgi:hypothetical protein|tara:strand:- start:246 stop:593 length:348 start_codon:yes stop_codon:yes gene_type:complete